VVPALSTRERPYTKSAINQWWDFWASTFVRIHKNELVSNKKIVDELEKPFSASGATAIRFINKKAG
jgi:hypothetical protein